MKRLKILNRKKATKTEDNQVIPKSALIAELDGVLNGFNNSQETLPDTLHDTFPDTMTESVPDASAVTSASAGTSEQLITPNTPIQQLERQEVDDLPEDIQQIVKETLDNADIIEMFNRKNADELNLECNKLLTNLKAFESARFKITMKSKSDVLGFSYHVLCSRNFLFTSHLEQIVDNQVHIRINNLMNKDVEFTISYVAFL